MCVFLGVFVIGSSFEDGLYAKNTIFQRDGSKNLYKTTRRAYYNLMESDSKKNRLKEWMQVVIKFQYIVDNFPKSPEAHKAAFTIARMYSSMYKRFNSLEYLDKAIFYFRFVISLDKNNSLVDDALYSVGEILFKRKKYSEAKKFFQQK